jgi:hypothetical protein
MDSNWSIVYTCGKLYTAEMLKEYLADNGILSIILNKQDSSYHIGDIEVYTQPEDVMKAKVLIEKFEI